MDSRDDSSEGPIAISFNHDASCVSIGTRSGFYIYNLVPTLEVRYFCFFSVTVQLTGGLFTILKQQRLANVGEGMRIVEMLYVTSLLAVVGSGDTAK